jgi:hypothetical protein
VLTHLHDTLRAAGRPGAARATWRKAQQIFTELDGPDAEKVATSRETC